MYIHIFLPALLTPQTFLPNLIKEMSSYIHTTYDLYFSYMTFLMSL